MADSDKKNSQYFLGEAYDILEVHRRHILILEHGEESLEKFLNKLNSFYPTIKFIAEYSNETINFSDINIRLVEGKLMTDLFVQPTNTHQFLDPSSFHPYQCKKGMPYSQSLRVNRICSDNKSFDKHCNDLKGWLMERG